MRPQSLTPLFAQVTSLPGIGPRLGKLVEKLAGPQVVDLLWHLPFAVVDRRNAPVVAQAQAGEVATLTVTVDQHVVPRSPRQPYRVWCSDESGRICVTYFNGREDYLRKLLPIGKIPHSRPSHGAGIASEGTLRAGGASSFDHTVIAPES